MYISCLGWIIAIIACALVIFTNAMWARTAKKINDDWDEFCGKLNQDWADYCTKICEECRQIVNDEFKDKNTK
jgi:hypothetical protein